MRDGVEVRELIRGPVLQCVENWAFAGVREKHDGAEARCGTCFETLALGGVERERVRGDGEME